MKITRLELEDFRSYARARIDFLPGTNAIIGANGSGKSSLLQAIGFALFDFRENTLSDCLREGAKSGGVIVRLESSLDGREYEVERRISGQSTTRYRVYDCELGTIIAEGGESVRNWIHQHLRIDESIDPATLFEHTIGVPQGLLTSTFQQAPAVRQAIFNRVLQVDEYERARGNLRDTVRHLTDLIHHLERRVDRMEERLLDLDPRVREEAQLREEIGKLQQVLASLEQRLEELGRAVSRLDQQEEQIREIERSLQELQTKAEYQRSLLASAQAGLEQARAAQELVAASQAGYAAYEAAEQAWRDLERKRTLRDQLLARDARLRSELAGTRAGLERIERALQDIASAERRIGELAPLAQRQKDLEEQLRAAERDHSRLELARRQESIAAAEYQRVSDDLRIKEDGFQQATTLEQ